MAMEFLRSQKNRSTDIMEAIHQALNKLGEHKKVTLHWADRAAKDGLELQSQQTTVEYSFARETKLDES